MTSRTKGFFISGNVLVLGYCALNAVKSVYEGHVLVASSPAFLAANVFLLAQVVYVFLQRDLKGLLARSRRAVLGVLWINVTTALSWFAVLYALASLPPAVVNSLVVGLIPVISLALAPLFRRSVPVIAGDVVSAAGCLAAALLLIYFLTEGENALGEIAVVQIVIGSVAAAATALGVAANTFTTKSLTDAGFVSSEIMALRFTLLNVLAAALTTWQGGWDAYSLQALTAIIVLAVTGVFIGVYLLQIGISRTEPIIVALLFPSNLFFTYAAQYLDPRLSPNLKVLGCAILVALFSIYGVYARWSAAKAATVAKGKA